MRHLLIGLAFCCAAVPALLWVWNMLLYREPDAGSCAEMGHCVLPDAVSVLIPARNEERVIAASIASLLASRGVEIEIIVLDDGSTDRTAEIVRSFAARDPRVRLESSPALPGGWNGKQHACYSACADWPDRIFSAFSTRMCVSPPKLWLNVRVSGQHRLRSGERLSPPGNGNTSRVAIVAADSLRAAFLSAAGRRCVLCLRPALRQGVASSSWCAAKPTARAGGHAQIRTTMHDGLLLPQLFRRHGLRTDIADLTHLATCRMYHNASEVWRGLAKNATEGMAAPARILPFTFLLFCGQILPSSAGPLAAIAPRRTAAGRC